MEKVTAFFHKHPIESALLAGVAVIALYFTFFKSAPAAQGDGGAQAALQNAYFQAEGIQAQSGAAIQVANITANQNVALGTLAANTSTTNATTWANEDVAVTESNNQAAVAGYPYEVENSLINSLSDLSGQTQTTTTQSKSSGFFGIGASNKSNTVTTPTAGALSASDYLDQIANGLFAHNGGG